MPNLRAKKRMKDIQLKKITVDDVYVSILTRTRVTTPEGWTRMEPVAKRKIDTGSLVIDAVGQALAEDCRVTSTELARAMHTTTEVLGAVFTLLTGVNLREFIKQYQYKRACEWLKCTDLNTTEVARRSGFTSHSALAHFFIKWLKCSPTDYRKRNRPADFRERYEWE